MSQRDDLPPYIRDLHFSSDTAQGAASRLLVLDTAMQQHYETALRAVAALQTPVIFAEFNEVGGAYTLLREGREETVQPVPQLYAMLKSVAHTVLGVYTILAPYFAQPFAADGWHGPLQDFTTKLATALDALPRAGLSKAAEERCAHILSAGVRFGKHALQAGTFTVQEYKSYARSVLADVNGNISEAAALQVDGFAPVLTRWRQELGDEQWERTYAMVSTVWAMRRYNVHQQVLVAAMGGEAAIDKRVFIAEGVEGRENLRLLLGRILLDRGASGLVFDDVNLLDRELMGPATKDALARRAHEGCPVRG